MDFTMDIINNNYLGEIGVTNINNELWFVANTLASKLEYDDMQSALKEYVDFEDRASAKITHNGTKSLMNIVNETGLYCLIMGSKAPVTRPFKKWFASTVLKNIREKEYKEVSPVDIQKLQINSMLTANLISKAEKRVQEKK